MTTPLFFWTVLALCSLYVFWRGGAAERVGMAIFAIGCILTPIAASDALSVRFHAFEVGMFLVDVVVFFALLALALVADRYWPLWVAGLQLVGTLSHTLVLTSSQVVAWAYAVTQSIWGYPMLLLIVIGTVRHQRRLKRNGVDPSWTRSSGRPGRVRPGIGPTP